MTKDPTADTIRPMVPAQESGGILLLWLRGTYTSDTNYALDVVGMLVDPA